MLNAVDKYKRCFLIKDQIHHHQLTRNSLGASKASSDWFDSKGSPGDTLVYVFF